MPSLFDVRVGQNPVVERLLVGYQTAGVIGPEIFTPYPFAFTGGSFPIFSAENARVWDTAVADGADTPTGDIRLSRAAVTMQFHKFQTPLTDEQTAEWLIQGISPNEVAAKNSMDVVNRRYEVDCSLVACNAASYAAGLSINLAAAWANVATPILTNIFTGVNAVRAVIGKTPNVFWCDYATWTAIQLNTQVATQAAVLRGAPGQVLAPVMVTREAFAALIGVGKVLISEVMNGTDATPVTFGDPWANGAGVAIGSGCAGLAYVPATGFFEVPFGYTFRAPGYPQVMNPYRNENRDVTYHKVKDKRGVQIVPPATGAIASGSGYVFIRTRA